MIQGFTKSPGCGSLLPYPARVTDDGMPAPLFRHLQRPEEVNGKSYWQDLVQSFQRCDDDEAGLLQEHVKLRDLSIATRSSVNSLGSSKYCF